MNRKWPASFFLLACITGSGPASAHAFPVGSRPRVGAVLRHAPARIVIRFDDALRARGSEIVVTDARGRIVSRPRPRVSGAHRRTLSTALEPLAAGSYTVRWVAVDSDGHRTTGRYRFRVLGRSATQ